MYFIYILYSRKTDKYYIGSTDKVDARLKHHNSGSTPSTKAEAPEWVIKYTESLSNRRSALKRELEIKKKKSRKYIEWLISMTNMNSSAGLRVPKAFGKVIGSTPLSSTFKSFTGM